MVQKCPVCEGRGTVDYAFYDGILNQSTAEVQCRSCHGTGLVYDWTFPSLPPTPTPIDPYVPPTPWPLGTGPGWINYCGHISPQGTCESVAP